MPEGRLRCEQLDADVLVCRCLQRRRGFGSSDPTPAMRTFIGAVCALMAQIVSGTISIAPQGHSATQMPQPLQKS